ncbi:MAG: hypothetical protein WC645_06570 [Candidatus Margulisiibacteriota bacterium]
MNCKGDSRGYTIIELVIIITLLGLLSFVFGAFITESMDAWVFVKARENALGTSRYAIERMVTELRRIQKPNMIITSATSEVSFVDIEGGTVTFSQEATNLLRNSDILATGLVNGSGNGLRFTYLDVNGNPTPINQNIRSIRVWLKLNKFGQTMILESAAKVRNL